MKTRTAGRKREVNPIKLVWLITLLTVSVGVFMVYLVWSTLTDIRTERENIFALKEKFISLQTRLESSLATQKTIMADLAEALEEPVSGSEDLQLIDLVNEYRKIAPDADLLPLFAALDQNINKLLNVKNRLTWWAGTYSRNIPRIPPERKKIESILFSLSAAVDRAEGEQRLDRAANIRSLTDEDRQSARKINTAIMELLAVPNAYAAIRRDVVTLIQLSQRLHTIIDPENLTLLKDREIGPLLAWVRASIKLAKDESFPEYATLQNLLEEYGAVMFGQGYSIDEANQMIFPGYGGLYSLISDRLRLENEKKTLQGEASQVYESITAVLAEIAARMNTITQQEGIKAEKVLGQTWRTMVIIWIVTSLIYAMLAYEIIMAARRQIEAIEDSNIELEAMAEELRKSEARLHDLSSDLFAVQEKERKRISFELHDELGQSMAALKLQVGSVARRLGEVDPVELKLVCDEMRENINQIIENVRRLARDLSPVVLDDLGLQAGIEYLVNNFAKIYNVKIRYQQADINHLFNEESQRIIYRILQEALNNIGKHAMAKQVTLTVAEEQRAVRFTVRDDGRGFNVQKTLDKKGDERGMGLAAMSERVRILGGKINIVSRPGIDTTVTFTVPTSIAAAAAAAA
ncbi:MAG: sensor histidine kinase [Deltaproteobacteria bacterium]|nr:sensor histidine kinase [Deltaproteobacteria bacterium]